MKIFYTLISFLIVNLTLAQGSNCGNAIDLGTPTSTTTCVTQSNGTTGATPCYNGGNNNDKGVTWFRFCTNANNDCIQFDFSNGTSGDEWVYLIYEETNCFSNIAGWCIDDIDADGTPGTSITTTDLGLDPGTCYYMRIHQKSKGTFTVCATSNPIPSNDNCAGALTIDSTPLATNNQCASPGPTTNAPTIVPADLCALSLENTSWYTFAVLNTGDVVFTLDNMDCIGGGSGYQLGFFTGDCGSLTNFGCTSGSSGSVDVTVSSLTAGEIVTVAMDGNGGAICDFDISASNTQPTPVEMSSWIVKQNSTLINTLEWRTFSETNNKEFVIQRSNDTKEWEEIAILEGQGNSSVESNYSFDDRTFTGEVIYYRLKQVDFDGTIKYTKIVSVKNKQNASNIIVGKFDMLGRPVNADYQGVIIVVYEDGHKEKIYQVND